MARDHTGLITGAGRAGAGCGAQLAGLVLIVALAAVLFDKLRGAFDPMERSARADQIYRAQRYADDMYAANLTAGWLLRLAPSLALAVFLCGLSVVVLLILYRQLAAWQTLRARHMIALTRAQVQRFPDSLQTLAFHGSSRSAPLLDEPAWGDEAGDDAAADVTEAPAFEELLTEFGPGRPRVLGRDLATGELVRLPVEDLFNIGLGGTSGAGKSWTAAAIAAQHALAGGRLIVVDPHGHDARSVTQRIAPLRPAFFCAPAIELRDITAVVGMVRSEVAKRKGGRAGKPWLVIVDEYAALMRSSVADALGLMVEELGQEGRKFGVTALVSSQVWNGTRAGGSEVRDALASHIIHRLRPAQARMLTGLPAEALPSDLHTLPPGHFYLLDTSGDLRRVVAPLMSESAVVRVAALLTNDAPTLDFAATSATVRLDAAVKSARSQNEADFNTALNASVSAEAARAMALFRQGLDVPQIALELGLTKSTSGAGYQQAARKVQAMLRAAVGGER